MPIARLVNEETLWRGHLNTAAFQTRVGINPDKYKQLMALKDPALQWLRDYEQSWPVEAMLKRIIINRASVSKSKRSTTRTTNRAAGQYSQGFNLPGRGLQTRSALRAMDPGGSRAMLTREDDIGEDEIEIDKVGIVNQEAINMLLTFPTAERNVWLEQKRDFLGMSPLELAAVQAYQPPRQIHRLLSMFSSTSPNFFDTGSVVRDVTTPAGLDVRRKDMDRGSGQKRQERVWLRFLAPNPPKHPTSNSSRRSSRFELASELGEFADEDDQERDIMNESQRRPHTSYTDTRRNGFFESVPLPSPAYEPANDVPPDALMIRNHKFMMYILATKGEPVPAHYLDPDMTPPDASEPTPTGGHSFLAELKVVEEKIAKLRAEHEADLSQLIAFTAEAYRAERHDRLSALDLDSPYWENRADSMDPQDAEALAALAAQHANDVHMPEFENDADDALESLKYAHLQELLPLLHQKSKLQAHVGAAKRARDAQFPRSRAELNGLDGDTKLRVARYLVTGANEKERMMDNFGWVWRQCQPLVDEFARDDEFADSINQMLRDSIHFGQVFDTTEQGLEDLDRRVNSASEIDNQPRIFGVRCFAREFEITMVFSKRSAMDLDQWHSLKKLALPLAKGLKDAPYEKQTPSDIRDIKAKLCERMPYLQFHEDTWPAESYLRRFLIARKARNDRRRPQPPNVPDEEDRLLRVRRPQSSTLSEGPREEDEEMHVVHLKQPPDQLFEEDDVPPTQGEAGPPHRPRSSSLEYQDLPHDVPSASALVRENLPSFPSSIVVPEATFGSNSCTATQASGVVPVITTAVKSDATPTKPHPAPSSASGIDSSSLLSRLTQCPLNLSHIASRLAELGISTNEDIARLKGRFTREKTIDVLLGRNSGNEMTRLEIFLFVDTCVGYRPPEFDFVPEPIGSSDEGDYFWMGDFLGYVSPELASLSQAFVDIGVRAPRHLCALGAMGKDWVGDFLSGCGIWLRMTPLQQEFFVDEVCWMAGGARA
ncbi:hypothetical protein CONPUDRAFT_146621 [Coniophora puteana RWD-64-598 SS2]|uniref:Uncharacterized protein n=1 Tax=Coniophora puteana (strain RWD-64-598) TaxID=741705 RepID=A0A5M3MDJ1_CONPW|nr:uncharacterized protein CONPUDRAFT_146621 [Coniophora puteana RWD-64-598 SS2]EIW76940.1 hypothetical protein CONPUDRAFT_146621 [Coniophora puteana RWD-64-598 SS2]